MFERTLSKYNDNYGKIVCQYEEYKGLLLLKKNHEFPPPHQNECFL